jgi:hypothetical protein
VLRKLVSRIGLSDTFGARHLAPAAAGPAAHWRDFTTALDAVALDEAGENQAIAGAQAAFPMSPPWPSRRAAKPHTGLIASEPRRRQGSATGSFALQHLRYEGANQQRLRGQERGR